MHSARQAWPPCLPLAAAGIIKRSTKKQSVHHNHQARTHPCPPSQASSCWSIRGPVCAMWSTVVVVEVVSVQCSWPPHPRHQSIIVVIASLVVSPGEAKQDPHNDQTPARKQATLGIAWIVRAITQPVPPCPVFGRRRARARIDQSIDPSSKQASS